METQKERLIEAILPNVVFDGWTDEAFVAACTAIGLSAAEGRMTCPNGARDLAIAFHKGGDEKMRGRLADTDLGNMRIRERVTHAVRTRIEIVEDKDLVRRGTTLFALPQNTAAGAALIWGTADVIWTALGDPATDYNWYSKRAILSGVYSSTVLYWLGDDSEGDAETWAFLARRIEDVMRFEAAKSQMRANPLTKGLVAGIDSLLAPIKAPSSRVRTDLPGRWKG